MIIFYFSTAINNGVFDSSKPSEGDLSPDIILYLAVNGLFTSIFSCFNNKLTISLFPFLAAAHKGVFSSSQKLVIL